MNLRLRESPPWDTALAAAACVLLVAGSLSIAVTQIVLGLALALLLARGVVAGARPPRLGLEGPALALAAWAALMIPFSTDPGQSLVFYRRFYLFAALWVGAAAAGGEGRRAWLLACLLAGAVVSSLWGAGTLLAETGSLFGRRLGQLSNPMTSGAVLMMVVLTAGAVLLQRGLPGRVRAVVAVAALPVLGGLVLTVTRSAWFGLVAGGLAMLVVARPRLLLPAGLGAILLAALLLFAPDGLLPERMARITSAEYLTSGASTSRRLTMWQGGLAMVRDKPLTGMGDRDLRELGPLYYDEDPAYYHGHLHSNPVMFAALWGLPGLVLASVFIGAQAVLLVRQVRGLRRRPPDVAPWAEAWALAAVGVWCGLLVAGCFEWYFGDAETQTLNLAIIGIALGAGKERKHD
ncbi:MAG: O-antigen ligase family protein [Candidatus Krumholzibacteriia bacterium]